VSTTPGRLQHNKGKEPSAMKLTCGTLLLDNFSMYIFTHKQVSLGAGETLLENAPLNSLL